MDSALSEGLERLLLSRPGARTRAAIPRSGGGFHTCAENQPQPLRRPLASGGYAGPRETASGGAGAIPDLFAAASGLGLCRRGRRTVLDAARPRRGGALGF